MDSTGEVKQFDENYLFWNDYFGSRRETAIWFQLKANDLGAKRYHCIQTVRL